MQQLTQEQEKVIQNLMKTSADDVIENTQTKTNIELAHSFLEKAQGNNASNEQLALVYSNLAITDQLVLLNRTLSIQLQIMMQQRQGSGIVVPQMKLN